MTEQVIKLTKAQKEFFGAFAFNAVTGLLVAVHEMNDSAAEVEDLVGKVQDTDLTELTQIIGQKFLERVDFATLKKVDKFLKSEDAVSVVVASTEVSNSINDQLIELVASLLPGVNEQEA
jgi:hypothetical protein